jgi:hypothetical protein
MMEGKGDTVAGLRERESFENGVSVEGEFAFTMGVAAFCKEAVREGSFKGSYVLNVKEQMEGRALREGKEGKKVSVLVVGGSQMGRIGQVMLEKGGGGCRGEGGVCRSEGGLGWDGAEEGVG